MCNETAQMCCNMMPFIKAIKILISIVQWSVPLLLIVLGTIDMFKAVASNDEKGTTAAKSTFIKRLAYGVAIFLVPFVVNLILGLMEDNIVKDKEVLNDNWLSCWNGNIDCKACDNIYENDYNTNNGNNNTETGSGNDNSGSGNNGTTKTCYKLTIYDDCVSKFNSDSKDKNYCTYSFDFQSSTNSLIDRVAGCLMQCDVANGNIKFNGTSDLENNVCTCRYERSKNVRYLEVLNSSNFSSSGENVIEKYECSNPDINCLGGNIESFCKLVN